MQDEAPPAGPEVEGVGDGESFKNCHRTMLSHGSIVIHPENSGGSIATRSLYFDRGFPPVAAHSAAVTQSSPFHVISMYF